MREQRDREAEEERVGEREPKEVGAQRDQTGETPLRGMGRRGGHGAGERRAGCALMPELPEMLVSEELGAVDVGVPSLPGKHRARVQPGSLVLCSSCTCPLVVVACPLLGGTGTPWGCFSLVLCYGQRVRGKKEQENGGLGGQKLGLCGCCRWGFVLLLAAICCEHLALL